MGRADDAQAHGPSHSFSAIWLAIHARGGSVKAVFSRPTYAPTKGVIRGTGGCDGYSL